jgi:hypothetical protein
MKRLALALLFAMVTALLSAHSPNPQRPTKPLTFDGTWVSYSAEGSVRLELQKAGVGLLAVQSERGYESFRLTTDAPVNGVRFDFHVTPVGSSKPIAVYGSRYMSGFALTLEVPNGSTTKFFLERENDSVEQIERLKKAVDEMRSAE